MGVAVGEARTTAIPPCPGFGLRRERPDVFTERVFASVTSDIRHITFAGAIPTGCPCAGRLIFPRPSLAERGTEESPPLDAFSKWLLTRAGIDPAAYRPLSLLRRLPACLRQLRVGTPEAALRLLQRDPGLIPVALGSMLIGVSGFFRDPAVFSALEDEILPRLLADRDGGVRVFSAGASTGQELYSVAMLLEEQGAFGASELLGLDCRSEAIERAGFGCYEGAELDGLSPGRRDCHLRVEGGRLRVRAHLRAGIEWRVGDALSFVDERPRDLILFRNVAIYLDPVYAAAVWARLTDQLVPGGILVTGKAEEPPRSLGYARVAPCVFRRRRS